MSVTTWNQDRIDWRRVGALSATFNVHILAGAALLLATAQLAPSLKLASPPPTLQVDFVDLTPPPPPPPPPIVKQELAPDLVTPVVTATAAPPIADVPVAQPQTTAVIAVPVTTPRRTPDAVTLSTAALTPDRGVAYERVRQPRYPADVLRRGIEGETLLRVLIGSDGQVLEVSINRSSGDRRLDRAAESAVREWRFSPAIQNGQPITAWVQIPISFRIGQH